MQEAGVLALADDLTGALEVGAKFAGAGVSSVVTLSAAHAPVTVVDTETRHVPAEEAARVASELARGAGGRLLYKKTDSTLRGNIAAELRAVLDAASGVPLIYAPAYPLMGRTVRGGRLYVDGIPVSETAFARDPLDPVRESDIVRLLGGDARVVTAHELHRVSGPGFYVVDGESAADVREAAAFIARTRALAAGPAALAEELAACLDLPRGARPRWPAIRRCVILSGSLHPASRRQIAFAERQGWTDWTVLPWRPGYTPDELRGAIERERPDAVAVFGGDTAAEVLRAFGAPPLYPMGEIVPGVPVSRAGDLYLITKAGGFGPDDILGRIKNLLQ